MTTRRLVLAGAALAIVAAIVACWPAADAPVATTAAVEATPHAPAPAPLPASAATITRAAAPAASASPAPETVADRVDRLSRSHDPRDQLSAFGTIRSCIDLRRHETALVQTMDPQSAYAQHVITETACGNLASDQVQGRRKLLDGPLAAGLHAAALNLYWYGPEGNGPPDPKAPELPQDDAWRAAVAAAYAAAEASCDATAFDDLADRGDPAVAADAYRQLVNHTAAVTCVEQGKADANERFGYDILPPKDYSKVLTPAQVAEAIAAGRQLATQAHAGR